MTRAFRQASKAIAEGKLDEFRESMLKVDDINGVNFKFMTPLFYAVEANCLESVKYLLENNAAANISCSDGRTPLHDACERGNPEIVAAIIAAPGVDVNAVNWEKVAPLHLAASYGRLEAVEQLLNAGADINAQDAQGNTPLHRAAIRNHPEIAQFLITSGCNHQALNGDGLKAAEVAPEPLKSNITEFMINKLMTKSRSLEPERPLTTPGLCILCQNVTPVFRFGPCPHVQVCDTCYINNKEKLQVCPICGKNLKRVSVKEDTE